MGEFKLLLENLEALKDSSSSIAAVVLNFKNVGSVDARLVPRSPPPRPPALCSLFIKTLKDKLTVTQCTADIPRDDTFIPHERDQGWLCGDEREGGIEVPRGRPYPGGGWRVLLREQPSCH